MSIHLFRHAIKGAVNYYSKNPHHVAPHAAAAVQIGAMAWTHGHKVAHHTAKFMGKAALKGFNLFRRS